METKETKTRLRREYTRGGSDQKMVNFRCDLENLEWLSQQPNKGRALNNLMAAARAAALASEAKPTLNTKKGG